MALHRLLVPVSLLGLLSACGTTVPVASTPPQSALSSDGAGSGPVGTAGSTDSATGSPDVQSSGTSTEPGSTTDPGAGGQGSEILGSGSARSGLSSPASLHLGPGVDAKTIRVGFTIQANNATVSSLASAYNVQLADSRGAYEALVAYVNAHGGVGGRTLVPTYYTYDPTGGNSDQIGEAACQAFTEDGKVFAALDPLSGSRTFNACMQQRGRLNLQYGLYFGSRASWRKYPGVAAADGLPFEDGARVLAEHLAATGFLSKTTKLGVIVRSSPDLQDAYAKGFLPALTAAGLKVTMTQSIRDAQDSTDLSGYTADISSAVLKFRSSGVDRVVFFDIGSYAALVFSENAEQQKYRPLYGFSSLNSIVALGGSGSAAPQAQMVGSQGVSWEMNADGLTTTRTAPGKRCDAILRAAGIVATDAGTEASYLKTCQTFFLFTTAAQAAGKDLNRGTFLSAVERLRTTFVSTNTWNGLTRFGAGKHGGVSVFRPFAYDESCSCFAVRGDVQEVGTS